MRLLGVLPASARTAELAALEHAVSRALALGMAPHRREPWLRELGRRLGVPAMRVDLAVEELRKRAQ